MQLSLRSSDNWSAGATVTMLAGPMLGLMLSLYATGGTISPGNEWGFAWKPLWFALSLIG
jgi:hypothetical protein